MNRTTRRTWKRGHGVLGGLLVAAALGAGCGNAPDDVSDVSQASTRQVCSQFWGVTGQTCFWAGGQDGDVVCNDDMGWIPYCYNVEEATTPVPLYRSINSSNNTHQYRTDPGLASGYVSQGIVFWLANDNYAGAVPWTINPPLSSGSGYYFPNNAPTAIPNLVPLYSFWNPQRGDALLTLDPNGGKTLPCNIVGHPSGPPTVDCWLGGGIMAYVGSVGS